MPGLHLKPGYVFLGEIMIIYFFYEPIQRAHHCMYYVSVFKQ
jgi:hypothetical protein